MAHSGGWQVGMEVCVVEKMSGRTEPRPRVATISKIGRSWITIDDGYRPKRFDPETRQLDGRGYTSPGMVYASEAEYRETTARDKLWVDMRNRLPLISPDHLTADDIENISALIWPIADKEPD